MLLAIDPIYLSPLQMEELCRRVSGAKKLPGMVEGVGKRFFPIDGPLIQQQVRVETCVPKSKQNEQKSVVCHPATAKSDGCLASSMRRVFRVRYC